MPTSKKMFVNGAEDNDMRLFKILTTEFIPLSARRCFWVSVGEGMRLSESVSITVDEAKLINGDDVRISVVRENKVSGETRRFSLDPGRYLDASDICGLLVFARAIEYDETGVVSKIFVEFVLAYDGMAWKEKSGVE